MPEFSGRFSLETWTSKFNGIGGRGLLLNEGKPLTEQRLFSLKALRSFGFGKKSLGNVIQNEVNEFIQTLDKLNGKPFKPENTLNLAMVNSIWTIIAGQRLPIDDEKLRQMVKLLTE